MFFQMSKSFKNENSINVTLKYKNGERHKKTIDGPQINDKMRTSVRKKIKARREGTNVRHMPTESIACEWFAERRTGGKKKLGHHQHQI